METQLIDAHIHRRYVSMESRTFLININVEFNFTN